MDAIEIELREKEIENEELKNEID